MSEPVRLFKCPSGKHGFTAEPCDSPAREAIVEGYWMPAAAFRALEARAAALERERDEYLASCRKAMTEIDAAEAVLIDRAGVDGDTLAECCEALMKQRDEARALLTPPAPAAAPTTRVAHACGAQGYRRGGPDSLLDRCPACDAENPAAPGAS